MEPESGKAKWSLILGIIGILCCAPCGIAAIVLSKQAQNAGNTSGQAKAGFILGIVAVVLWVVAIIVNAVTGTFSNLMGSMGGFIF